MVGLVQVFWNLVFNFFVQLGQQRPVQTLLVVVRGMVTEVAGQRIVDRCHDVVGRFEIIVHIQAGVVRVGYPGGEKQAADHGHDKNQ